MLFRRAFVLLASATLGGFLLAGEPSAALAATAASPEAFIESLARQALATITQGKTPDEREKSFRTLLDANFDVPRISRFVLGRYWLSASEADRQQFQTLFETYIVRAYSNRFSEYSGETVKVTGSRPQGELSLVSSQIVQTNGAPPVKVDWIVRKDGDDYRITDVSVEGVSMVLTEKQQFASVIERDGNGVAGLNKVIAAKIGGSETALK